MKVKTIEQVDEVICHGIIPLAPRRSEAAARCTGIIDIVACLCGKFGIDAQADAKAGIFGFSAEIS